jgi:hypothetical protein
MACESSLPCRINDLRCGNSILRFGRIRKLLIRLALEAGSSGRIRTYNPPVNSVTQVFGFAGSRAGSSDGILLIAQRAACGRRAADA